jgi:hypothetical protein
MKYVSSPLISNKRPLVFAKLVIVEVPLDAVEEVVVVEALVESVVEDCSGI